MSKGVIQTVAGGLLIAAGVAAMFVPGGQGLGIFLITAGIGLVLSGIGTMLAKGPLSGFATTTRNPIAPWEVIYGRARVGGTIVYIAQFPPSGHDSDIPNKYLDMVVVVACHPCESVDELLFDNQLVQIGIGNTSFPPLDNGDGLFQPILNLSAISRAGSVVTVTAVGDIPLLEDGDTVNIDHHNNGGILDTYNATGKYQVTIIDRIGGNLSFYYLSGGTAFSVNGEGRVSPVWANYKNRVYMEVIGDQGTGDLYNTGIGSDSGPYNRLGHQQTVGETFVGMTTGTPNPDSDGSGVDLGTLIQNGLPYFDAGYTNPWTPFCSLVGKTAVHIRLAFDKDIFVGGIPQISFHVKGKCDIQDPRSSPPVVGYTENAALCIADYLSDTTWGFKAPYGTEINIPALIAAANICDESVQVSIPYLPNPVLGAGLEYRYTINGKFNLTMKRGEILQNLLTACSGRIVYVDGMFSIYPAAWTGATLTVDSTWVMSNATDSIKWRPIQSISNTYNGVKGTYISPANNWQSADFPRYAQDSFHGYNNGDPADFYDLNLTIDGGDRRWFDIQLPFTLSPDTAQRLAKLELMRRRRQGTGTFQFNMYGYQIVALDVLAMSLDYFGWDGKTLEVLSSRLRADKQQNEGGGSVVALSTEIDVQETDEFVYDFELIEDLSPQGYQVPGIPNTLRVPLPPTNLQVIFDENGRAVLTWTPPADPSVTEIRGRYQLVVSPEGLWVSLGMVDVSVTQIPLPTLLRGASYSLALQSVDAAGVTSAWVQIVYVALSLPPQWAPFFVKGVAEDPLWSDEYTFDVTLAYSKLGNRLTLSHGAADPRVTAGGKEPVNKTIANVPAPHIVDYTVNPTGGHIPSNTGLYFVVTADDGAGNYTLPSNMRFVQIPAASPPDTPGTGTISLTINVKWPTVPGLTNYTVYIGIHHDIVTAQAWAQSLTSGPLSPPASPPSSPPGVQYSPVTFTVGGNQSPPGSGLVRTWNPPDPNERKVRLKGAIVYHAGVIGAKIDSVSGNTITSSATVDVAALDNWAGRVLFVTGRTAGIDPSPRIPLWSRRCTAFNPATGQFTFSGPAITGGLNDPQAGDVFIVSTLGYDNSSDPFTLRDPGWSSAGDVPTPHSGLFTNLETGMVMWVIKGKSVGTGANILANDSTGHFLDRAVPIDSTSVWIIVENGWPYVVDYPALNNPNPFQSIYPSLPIANLPTQQMFMRGYLVDALGQESQDSYGPYRILYSRGQGLYVDRPDGHLSPPASLDDTIQVLVANTAAGFVSVKLPDPSTMTGRRITIKKDLNSPPATFSTPTGLIR